MKFHRTDGGRAAAGFKGGAGDCVARAIAIATGRPYAEVHQRLSAGKAAQRKGARTKAGTSADTGIKVQRLWFRRYLAELGWTWTPTMKIGGGCKVHLREGELPAGRLIVRVSKHTVAVIDGVIHDTHDPSRGGTRCVYGYWQRAKPRARARQEPAWHTIGTLDTMADKWERLVDRDPLPPPG